MILFSGPAGAGKSVQGEKLAQRFSWRWLSAGNLLREANDPILNEVMARGELVPHDAFVRIMGNALLGAKDVEHIILDGFPRSMEQAEWLVAARPEHGEVVDVIIVLDVSRDELMKRLTLRARSDDTPEVIDQRLAIYQKESQPIINYFAAQGVPIIHVQGEGSIDAVHERVVNELTKQGFIK